MPLSKIQTSQMLDTPNLGRRNLIINGAMQVNQRGQTATNGDNSTADDIFTADRFQNRYQDGTSSLRIDSSNATITDHPLGLSNAAKIVCSTVDDLADATSVYMNIHYKGMEQQDLQHLQYGTSSAKKVTLSFWVKSGVTGTFFVSFQQEANTAGNKVRYHASYTISSANTWEKKTISIAGPGTGLNWLSNNTSNHALAISFHLSNSSERLDSTINQWFEDTTNTQTIRCGTGQTNFFLTVDAEFYLTGVQLEVGDTATDFEHRSYAEDLRDCQRYYFHTYRKGIAIGSSGTDNGAAQTRIGSSVTNHHGFMVIYAVPMRATPIITYYSITGTQDRVSVVGSDFAHDTNVSITGTYEMGERGINGIAIGAGATAIAGHVIATAEL